MLTAPRLGSTSLAGVRATKPALPQRNVPRLAVRVAALQQRVSWGRMRMLEELFCTRHGYSAKIHQ